MRRITVNSRHGCLWSRFVSLTPLRNERVDGELTPLMKKKASRAVNPLTTYADAHWSEVADNHDHGNMPSHHPEHPPLSSSPSLHTPSGAHRVDPSRSSELRRPSQRNDQVSGIRSLLPNVADHVTVDSEKKVIYLTHHQREALWVQRRQTYHDALKKIVITLESHLTPLEKCHQLVQLHESEIINQRLRLRSETYEEIFHIFYAVSTSGISSAAVRTSSSTGSTHKSSVDEVERSIHSQSAPFLKSMWTMYRYMVDSGSFPTPQIIQHVMGVLERVTRKDVNIEARAHSLMMDCDRMKFPPTMFTLSSYCGICGVNNAMHLAVARLADCRERFEQQPTAGVCTRVIHGLLRNGQHSQAMAFISTLGNVPVDSHLFNVILDAARHSANPESAFAMYKALQRSGITPSIHTMSILLEVLREEQSTALPTSHGESFPRGARSGIVVGGGEGYTASMMHRHLRWLVREMTTHRVRANGLFLNKLLECFVRIGDREGFSKLLSSMQRKGVRIFREKFPPEWIRS